MSSVFSISILFAEIFAEFFTRNLLDFQLLCENSNYLSNHIASIFKSEHAIAGLYLALLAGALANFIPDPTDGLNFYLDRKWRVELEEGKITPTQYWTRKVEAFYGLDSLWWLFVLGIAILVGGDIRRKAWVVGGIVGAGAVIGIVFNNIKKDKEFFSEYKLVKR